MPFDSNFRNIEQARVCEYMMKGAEPPSNESASSQRKVNPLSGATLMILKSKN
jgi:hypothetical protein